MNLDIRAGVASSRLRTGIFSTATVRFSRGTNWSPRLRQQRPRSLDAIACTARRPGEDLHGHTARVVVATFCVRNAERDWSSNC